MEDLFVNITSNKIRLSWIPPFSLDLTDIHPDIIYYGKVINITCGTETLFSNSNIIETELDLVGYTYSQHYIYKFIVIPRNNVQEAVNGIPLIKQGLPILD